MCETVGKIETSVRCFRKVEKGGVRRGLWLMTRPSGARGVFFHGDHCEIQAPACRLEDFESGDTPWHTEEITPEEALAELEPSWPEAAEQAREIFERHPMDEYAETVGQFYFVPKRTDDLKERCKPYIGKIVTVRSWHENVSMRDRYPDDEKVGFVVEFALDIPESELSIVAPPKGWKA